MDEKTLSLLEDLLQSEAMNTKKFDIFAKSCSDPGLKNLYRRGGKMHKSHFDSLYGYLTARSRKQGGS